MLPEIAPRRIPTTSRAAPISISHLTKTRKSKLKQENQNTWLPLKLSINCDFLNTLTRRSGPQDRAQPVPPVPFAAGTPSKSAQVHLLHRQHAAARLPQPAHSQTQGFCWPGSKGKTSMGWFSGFKLHVGFNHRREIAALKLLPL
jgi:hypothetical protein